jgi:hypothetical protein
MGRSRDINAENVGEHSMTEVRIRQNSKGQWIDAKTGRFVSKAVYEPYVRRKAEANAKRSASMKEYWNDVKKFRDIGYSLEEARKFVRQSPKYLAKRGKKPYHWSQFWKDVKAGKLTAEERKAEVRRLEDEGFELVS